ncbi:g6835 [Coccomyxa elongata]
MLATAGTRWKMSVPRSVLLGIVGTLWLLQLTRLTLVQGALEQDPADTALLEPLEGAVDAAATLKKGVLAKVAGFKNITHKLVDKLHPSSTTTPLSSVS